MQSRGGHQLFGSDTLYYFWARHSHFHELLDRFTCNQSCDFVQTWHRLLMPTQGCPLLGHHIDIPPTLLLALGAGALARHCCPEKIVNTAGVAHARRRPAGRRGRRTTSHAASVGGGAHHRRRHGRWAREVGRRGSAHRRRWPQRRRRARGPRWWRCPGTRRSRGCAGRRRRRRLGSTLLGTSGFVDPALLVRIIDKAGLLSKLGTNRLVGRVLQRFLLRTATEPRSQAPPLLGFGRLLSLGSFGWAVVSDWRPTK